MDQEQPRESVPAETTVDHDPPPPYSQSYGEIDLSHEGFNTNAHVTDDGRLDININERGQRLSSLLGPLQQTLSRVAESGPPEQLPPHLIPPEGAARPPPLNVVIHVVGSRGDVQPFVALGQVLKEKYGHRVRLATHPTFKEFVQENGLEFFSIGGDPAKLMAFMVKNPGLMPGVDAIRSGDIRNRRREIETMISGCWRSCYEAGDGTGTPISDENLKNVTLDDTIRPFVADAIIANPPSFAHVHCAEKLGIPLHLMFTMPYSPTQAFPHPLANIQSSNADPSVTNFLSYVMVEMMTWQGLGDVINRFREDLGIEPISIMWAPGMVNRMRIPYTYCWSPALIPKPIDWPAHIDISGFWFLSLESNYTPPDDLAAFLDAGPAPLYIGFGSIVVDDPNAMTKMIFDAVKKTGQRALVSKGWGGLGADELDVPGGVFLLGNCPHDWLFKRVSCVVHHGGAGTTAAGIALGRPTIVVPFFGDQPFWGAMVAKAGAGPLPIPYKDLTADKLAGAILEALDPAVLQKAGELGDRIRAEQGTVEGAESFHKHMDVDSLRCSLCPARPAVWRVRRTDIRLSAFAKAVLENSGMLSLEDVKLYRPKEYSTDPEPREPIMGGAAALVGSITSLMMGFVDVPAEFYRTLSRNQSNKSLACGKDSGSKKTSPAASGQLTPDDRTVESNSQLSATPGSTPSLLSPDQSVAGEKSINTLDGDRGSTSTDRDDRALSNQADGQELPAASDRRSCQREPMNLETMIGVGHAGGKIIHRGMKSPMDFTMSLARGFHNAPKLYGDDTVRDTKKITGIQSGLKAAGKEFGYGLYDGITGLVTQPIRGAKKGGVGGFVKGFGKGIGGVILKPQGGVFALTGYTMNGIYKEVQKAFGTSVQNYIMASRSAQGLEELQFSEAEERVDVLRRWHSMKVELLSHKPEFRLFGRDHKSRSPSMRGDSPHKREGIGHRREGSGHRLLRLHGLNKDQSPRRTFPPELEGDHAYPGELDANNEEFERAIQESIRMTSQGDPAENRLIERALRASVTELKSSLAAGADHSEAYDRAISASIAEAQRSRAEGAGSATEHQHRHRLHLHHSHDRDVDNADEDLERAVAESKQSYADAEARHQQEDSELEAVLNYVKKQSLAEAASGQGSADAGAGPSSNQGARHLGKAAEVAEAGDAEEEEAAALRSAIEESLKVTADEKAASQSH